jgi:hypothetical protein
MAAAAASGRAKGFVLVLVVTEDQAKDDHAASARVCRDYDVGSLSELVDELNIAAEQAAAQLQLRAAMGSVLARQRLSAV